MRNTRAVFCFLIAMLAPSAGTCGEPPDTDRLESQRIAFRAVFPEVERGNWQPVLVHESLLRDYRLWPDLQATYFRATLSRANETEIRAYLEHHGTLKPARELRYRYALMLAKEDRLDEFLEIYRQYYQGLEIPRLDCNALHAEILHGRPERITRRALELWMVGTSQQDECEPVFDYLRGKGKLGVEEYRQRFGLAIDARQFSLARYLSGPLAPEYRELASRWLLAQQSPVDYLQRQAGYAGKVSHRRQIVYALQQIAPRDPDEAAKHWSKLRRRYSFTAPQVAAVERHIALWSARNHSPQSTVYLNGLPAAAADVEVRRWRVRAGLRQQDWDYVTRSIADLPPEERALDQWQYWLAVSLSKQDRRDEARLIFDALATDRGYYGFLAADAIGVGYAFSHRPINADEIMLAELARRSSLLRARELFMVGLEGRGRSEWDTAVGLMSAEQKIQASVLAHRWRWHSRAIATAASVGHFDDLRVRYPLPYAESFARYSADAQIQPSWAYGVARSESLFMRDIRSSAGAVGVMQLMPDTGRRVARHMNYPYAGRVTLTDAGSNIRLGTRYLGQMFERFGESRVLATAAYNAGPLRVENWLPASGSQDARIWIENIPFNETRKYVRRVLETDTIFHWRLTGRVRRISPELPIVAAGREDTQVAGVD